MPLSATEKNLIAPPGVVDFITNISTADVVQAINFLPAVLPFPINIFAVPLVQGLTTALTPRIRFPQVQPGDIGRLALAAQAGSVISRDPFFGDAVISQPDQAGHLTELVRNAAIRRVAAEQDTSRAFLARRAVIEGLAESAQERGFASTIDPNLRGQAFRATADSPVTFRERDVFL